MTHVAGVTDVDKVEFDHDDGRKTLTLNVETFTEFCWDRPLNGSVSAFGSKFIARRGRVDGGVALKPSEGIVGRSVEGDGVERRSQCGSTVGS